MYAQLHWQWAWLICVAHQFGKALCSCNCHQRFRVCGKVQQHRQLLQECTQQGSITSARCQVSSVPGGDGVAQLKDRLQEWLHIVLVCIGQHSTHLHKVMVTVAHIKCSARCKGDWATHLLACASCATAATSSADTQPHTQMPRLARLQDGGPCPPFVGHSSAAWNMSCCILHSCTGQSTSQCLAACCAPDKPS